MDTPPLASQRTESGQPQQEAPWLSILLPVYNVAPWLGLCVDSIRRQQSPERIEIILLDDGSTDGSGEICRKICRDASHDIRMLSHSSSLGPGIARNRLLQAATGRYVWFMDSDDEMLPDAIATLHAIVETHNPDMILCDYRRKGRQSTSFAGVSGTPGTDRESLVQGVFASRRLYVWNRISRRELWGSLQFPPGRCFEDAMTMPWLCLRMRSFYYAREAWISYRVRAGSIMAGVRESRKFDARKFDDLANALAGFMTDTVKALGPVSPHTSFCIGDLIARHFGEVCRNIIKTTGRTAGWAQATAAMRHYRVLMEKDSPISFPRLAALNLRRGRLLPCLELSALLIITRTKHAGSAGTRKENRCA